jgi:hypothetical protein
VAMHFLEKFKPSTLWIISILLLAIMIVLPGSPFTLSVFIPVLASRLLPKFKLEIVFLYTILFGVGFTRNFFTFHLFGYNFNDPSSIILGSVSAGNTFSMKGVLLYAAGFVLYLFTFFLIFNLFKKIFKEINLASSIFLSLLILALVWFSQSLAVFKNDLVFVLCLSTLMMAKHAFYLFNYVRFFDRLPRSRKEFSTLIQPFWFLTFEAPENPIYQVEKSSKETQENLKATGYIFTTCFIFKIIMIVYMTGLNFLLTQKMALVIDDTALVNTLCLSLLKNWKSENAFILILCIFSYSVSYLGSSFFIYGRIVVGLARLCGFNLPDYINSPWKSQSFSDFFSRIMYYYNIIIINHFFYPALEFLRRFNLSRNKKVFIALNWALIFGGFFARFLKDVWKVYKLGFVKAVVLTSSLALPYMVVLSLAVTISLYFQKKNNEKKTNIFRMFYYFFLYSLIMPLNFSMIFGGFNDVVKFYLKILTLGLL